MRAFLSSLLPLFLVGCTTVSPPGIRPGDSVFDILTSGEISGFPRTNLPPELARMASGPFTLISLELAPDQWMEAGLPPVRLRSAIADNEVRYWSARPSVRGWDKSSQVQIYRQGILHSRWRPATEPFPGWDAWWDPSAGGLFALSRSQPQDVAVAFTVHPGRELAEYEPVLAAEGAPLSRVGSLVRTVQLERTSRRALFLPAPGCLTLPLGNLASDEVRVVVGIADHAYESSGGVMRQSTGRSDGAIFALEMSTGGRWKRIWEHTVGQSDLGTWHGPYAVDLGGYCGKRATMRLVTEPGPSDQPFFDYALWGELRFAGRARHEPQRPHIIVIDLDTLRRDRVGCHGAARGLTPRIDRWARQATVYDDCIAASSWTLPSTVSMFTGLAVHQHRVDRFGEVMTEQMAPVPLQLQRAGYETIGIAEGGYVSADFGFSLGFDVYDCTRFKDPRWYDVLDMLRRRRSERPVFLFLHTYMVHAPYPFDPRFESPSKPYASRLRGQDIEYPTVIEPHSRGIITLVEEDRQYIADMYDALVNRADEHVGAFIDSLGEALRGQPYALILTSDHGEEFLEHGLLGHAQSLFQELLAVPLIVRFPGQTHGMVEKRPSSGLDLAPTILDLAGLSFDGLPGFSLRSLPHPPRERIGSQYRSVHALVFEGLKLISGPVASPRGPSAPVQLYDLVQDPGERTDLYPAGHDSTAMLEERLVGILRSKGPRVQPTRPRPGWTGDLPRLEALGYVGHDSPRPGTVGSSAP
ncbi:sulfatase [Candidatus Fermentibacteria bacterium]|nr:sulfatase [Candidatus Fermentibacteria bacterium]